MTLYMISFVVLVLHILFFSAVNCLKCYACGFGSDGGKGCPEELTGDIETNCPAGSRSCVKSEALGESEKHNRRETKQQLI